MNLTYEQIDKLIDSAYQDGYRNGCNDTLQKVHTDIENIIRNHIRQDNHCNDICCNDMEG